MADRITRIAALRELRTRCPPTTLASRGSGSSVTGRRRRSHGLRAERERGRASARELVATGRATCAPGDHAVGAYERRPAGRQAIGLGERLGVDDVLRFGRLLLLGLPLRVGGAVRCSVRIRVVTASSTGLRALARQGASPSPRAPPPWRGLTTGAGRPRDSRLSLRGCLRTSRVRLASVGRPRTQDPGQRSAMGQPGQKPERDDPHIARK